MCVTICVSDWSLNLHAVSCSIFTGDGTEVCSDTPMMVGSAGHTQMLLGCRAETMILETKGGSPLTLGQYRTGIYCSRIMR